MFKTILHQIWNQRKMNGWIFLELLVVSFFLWMVIDPIYVITANRCIPKGYNSHGLYVVNVGQWSAGDAAYRAEVATDSLRQSDYLHLAYLLRNQPEVAQCCIAPAQSIPSGRSWSGGQLFTDTASAAANNQSEGHYVHVLQFPVLLEGEEHLLDLFGITDARTGGRVVIPDQPDGKILLSRDAARRLFGKADAIGRKLYRGDKKEYEVAGIYNDYKYVSCWQPYPSFAEFKLGVKSSGWMQFSYQLLIRLKQGADEQAFCRRFREEVMPACNVGNFYFSGIESIDHLNQERERNLGIVNKMRLQAALAGFALLCIFLGMVGTFWIRTEARSQEIGLMRSIGASRRTISKQFLIESWLLLSVAFVLALVVVFNYVWLEGFYVVEQHGTLVPDAAYPQNRFGAHFVTVSLLTYFMLWAIVWIGTYIPTRQAARTLPAEALRDE